MKSFAEREIFSSQELGLLKRATEIVSCLPHELDGWEVRCHELARAVSELLGLSPYEIYVADGYYGMVDHSWIWTSAPSKRPRRWELPNILDVYIPGSLPQVQLVHTATALPLNYRLDAEREDISWKHVRFLIAHARAAEAGRNPMTLDQG